MKILNHPNIGEFWPQSRCRPSLWSLTAEILLTFIPQFLISDTFTQQILFGRETQKNSCFVHSAQSGVVFKSA